jgi:hypothetical protein
MKVKTSQDTVKTLIELRERLAASENDFLNDLPTPEKYAILAMAWKVRGDYEDYEDAYYEATHKVSAKDLTTYLLNFRFLECHLQDALKLKWPWFECLQAEDDEDDEDDE